MAADPVAVRRAADTEFDRLMVELWRSIHRLRLTIDELERERLLESEL